MPRKAGDNELDDFSRGRIIGLVEGGCSQRVVANKIGCSQGTVSLIWNKWLSTGSAAIAPRVGRPRLSNARDDRRIRMAIIRDRFRSYRMLRYKLAVQVSRRTLNRRAQELGYSSHKPIVRISLTATHRNLRLNWCKQYQDKDCAFWRKYIFSDESRFNVEFNDGRILVHRLPSERDNENCIRMYNRHGGGGVMVWAAIAYNRKSRLIFIKGILDSKRYIEEVLSVEAVPFVLDMPGYIFQQDNAPCHSARATMKYLDSMAVEVLPWPSKSPDLNPIENLWDLLGRRIYNEYENPIANIQELQQRLEEQWDLIDQATICKLYDSMPTRIHDCVLVHGGHTRY